VTLLNLLEQLFGIRLFESPLNRRLDLSIGRRKERRTSKQ
jgi:hypothetical protein